MAKSSRTATTIYLDPKLAKAVKIKAALNGTSVSALTNDALARLLKEDTALMGLANRRSREKTRPYEKFLAELKRDGLI